MKRVLLRRVQQMAPIRTICMKDTLNLLAIGFEMSKTNFAYNNNLSRQPNPACNVENCSLEEEISNQ
jgi:hypothetical protein